jgi:hypothetical protein
MSGAVFFSAGHTVQWLNEWLYVAPEDVKKQAGCQTMPSERI